MITTHKLSDAQAAVLSGPVEFNANGSIAVTTGRENTLASLRKLGLLNGNLLTGDGNNARVSVQSGERKVTISEDGAATLYLSPVATCPQCGENETDATRHGAKCRACGDAGHSECMGVCAPVEPTAGAFDMANLTDAQITVMETNIGRVPEVITAAREIGANATVRAIDHHDTYYVPGTLTLRADVDPAAYSSAVVNANDTARENSWRRLSAVWFDCFDSTYALHRDENQARREREAFQAAQDAETAAEYAAMLAATHVIMYMGDDRAVCGERIDRRPVREGILRVSTDPSDATCPECITRESELAALDAVQPDDDDTDRAAAMEAALTASESHMEAPTSARDTHAHAYTTPATYPRTTADGRTVWACCESSIGAPCQHRTGARQVDAPMVVVEPSRDDRRKVVAWLLTPGKTHRREFRKDGATSLHVAYWAQVHGVRPASGRKFKWQQHETLSLAPARV